MNIEPAPKTRTECFLFRKEMGELFVGSSKKPAHLETCPECRAKFKRYETIVEVLKSSETLENKDSQVDVSKRKWNQTPWYVRSSVEGLGVSLIILALIALTPKIKSLYDRDLQRRLEAFDLAELADELEAERQNEAKEPSKETETEDDAVWAVGKRANVALSEQEPETSGEKLDLAIEEALQEAAPIEQFKVGNSEIWRFNITTVSLKETYPMVISTLLNLGLEKDHPGIDGIHAPGGIQFNLLVPKETIPALKHHIERMAKKGSTDSSTRSLTRTFSWFKNRSYKHIPAGQTRVIIWVSKI